VSSRQSRSNAGRFQLSGKAKYSSIRFIFRRDYSNCSAQRCGYEPTYNRSTLLPFEVVVKFKSLGLLILFLLSMVRPPVPLLAGPSLQLTPPGIQQPAPEDPARAKLEKDMAKKANQERQADLKRDTEKLLKLATELKEYVDKSNENVLSLNVLKKAEEIEKLAHSVKDKMKGPN
jgi:hypothetical protein